MFSRLLSRTSQALAGCMLVALFGAPRAVVPQSQMAAGSSYETDRLRQLLARADSLMGAGQLEQAEAVYRQAADACQSLAGAEGDTAGWRLYVWAARRLGRCQGKARKYADARATLEKALEVGREYLGDADSSVASLHEDLGLLYLERGAFQDAETQIRASIAIRLATEGAEGASLARLYNLMGIVAARTARVDSSFAYYRRALQIARKTLAEEDEQVATALIGMGNLYRAVSEHEKALELFRRALAVEEAVHGPVSPRAGSILYNMALVYMELGDYEVAESYFRRSLAVKLQTDGEYSIYVANTYNGMGVCYKRQGDYARAQESFAKALEIARKIMPEESPYIAMLYLNLGVVHGIRGEYEESRQLLEKALELRKRTRGEKNDAVAQIYQNLGTLEHNLGHYELAREYFRRSIGIAEELGDPFGRVAKNLYSLALLEEDLAHPRKSAEYAHQVIIHLTPGFADTSLYANPAIEDLQPKQLLLQSLECKARALRQLFRATGNVADLRASWATMAVAVDFLERERVSYRAEESKFWLSASAAGLYDAAIRTSLELYRLTDDETYLEQVFQYTERGKAGVLREATREVTARKFAGIPDEVLDQEKELRTALADLNTKMEKAKAARQATPLNIASLDSQRFETERRYHQLVRRLERDYPAYFELKYSLRVPSSRDVRTALDSESALVDYFWTDSLLVISVLTRERFDVRTVAVDTGFAAEINGLVLAMKKVDDVAYRRAARLLYRKLIEPVEPLLAGKRRLIVIPHRELARLPFETLLADAPGDRPYEELDYLIKRWEVSYHYSAALYVEGGKQRDRPADVTFAGFCPVFQDARLATPTLAENLRTAEQLASTGDRSVVVDGHRFSELPFTSDEVQGIARFFRERGRSAVTFVESEARESVFKSVSSSCRYLHLATHSFANNESPALSGIVFAQVADEPEDGILYAGELYNLDLGADLVVLSSCESGVGRQVRGEGMLALTRGFLYAGARNLLVTLWKISDRHTRSLMVEFYRHVLSGESYASALRQAKLKLIAEPSTAAPRLWAPFVLIGG